MIPFNRPFLAGKELSYISEAVQLGKLSGDGVFTQRCARWLEETIGCERAFLTHSCTAALEMTAMLCDIRPGDEIIMPSYTFVSTANAFVLRGGVPVFVDIRPDTMNIDEKLIRAAITPRTRAIVCVHYAGVPCEMNEIMRIASESSLFVIEDAAQALDSSWEGKPLGSIGHFGCLSFHETKNVTSGEGGALLVNDLDFIERAEIIREKGTNRGRFFRGEIDRYTWVDHGSSYLPGELIAAFLFAQLEHTERINAKRRELCRRYFDAFHSLEDTGRAVLPFRANGKYSGNGHMFFLVAGSLAERTELIAFLKERGVMAIFHYVPLHSSPAGIRFGRTRGDLSVTDRISDTLVRLPLFYDMTDEEQQQIIDGVLAFYAQR
jgi:dTDP-4-amino-4,6-dideoxygalactose transaminase